MPENIEFKKLAKIRTPLGNAQPDEVAALIAFIASDEGTLHDGRDRLDRRRPDDVRTRGARGRLGAPAPCHSVSASQSRLPFSVA
jgi:hypothetical protein